ncbi:histidine triad nucleotide-binding protein 3 [Drosophila novamexicana]|uniref:histidine triad nucleotide-binding protein 3 n=1 Tax=Drosophila novamexicana TaxID=47314 RepID=UPI0011E5C915|nr:histidine triad nucleotide-binding protein 3 [Drosophila novamexicana]
MCNKKSSSWFRKYFKKRFISFPLAFLTLCLFIKYSLQTENDHNDSSISECLFCGIASGKITPPKLEFENDEFVIFKDIKPAATYHYLAIPKQHFDSLKVLNKSHVGLVERMQNGMIQFLASKDVDISKAVIGFHVPPFISQNHLHLHGISPVSEMSFSDRISFMIPSFWFKSANSAIESLQRTDP